VTTRLSPPTLRGSVSLVPSVCLAMLSLALPCLLPPDLVATALAI